MPAWVGRRASSRQLDALVRQGKGELALAVRSLAGFGARWITVDHRLGAEAVERSRLEAEARGAELVAVTEPPGPTEPPEGRGKAVSAATRRAAAAGFQLVMGEPADLGIVAQMAPDTGVWVVGVDDEAVALDVVGKGAVGIVLAPSVTARSDLREAVAAIAAAVEAADTIGDQ